MPIPFKQISISLGPRSLFSTTTLYEVYLYDHAITRYMEETDIEDDPNTNPQITEIFLSSQNTCLL